MDVRFGALDLDIAFAAREEMRTEISAKFTRERLRGDLAAAGMRPVEVMTDPDGLFALSLERASIGCRAMNIEGSGALVAGGASGLGEATARRLHEQRRAT